MKIKRLKNYNFGNMVRGLFFLLLLVNKGVFYLVIIYNIIKINNSYNSIKEYDFILLLSNINFVLITTFYYKYTSLSKFLSFNIKLKFLHFKSNPNEAN